MSMVNGLKEQLTLIKDSQSLITKIPSTRFLGSKLKLIDWIWESINNLEFNTALDAFGGTASVSYLFKCNAKQVCYNDILRFNQETALALIENDNESLTFKDIAYLLDIHKKVEYSTFIQKTFQGMFFTDEENKWLDKVRTNISLIKNKYKKAIALSALCQACLIKRPFNLFHRNNLNLRFKNVKRSFGNKKAWDTPFEVLFVRFVKEYNNAVFDNEKKNKVVGGLDIFQLPTNFDLVYLDPPYLSKRSKTNYLNFYHFIEGLVRYENWKNLIDYTSSIKKFRSMEELDKWTKKELIVDLFRKMIYKFRKSHIVLSYRDDGVPSREEIITLFKEITGTEPIIKSKSYKYALSNGSSNELLFIYKR